MAAATNADAVAVLGAGRAVAGALLDLAGVERRVDVDKVDGLGGQLPQRRQVVGQVDGQSWTLGGSIDTGVDYNNGPHQWLNNLSILDSFSYAPPINEFVKATDNFVFHSEYYYRIPSVKWLGPFADFKLETSMFS